MTKLLTGVILESKKYKIYNHWSECSPPNCQTGCRFGKPAHKLKVQIENKPVKFILVFTDKLTNPDQILAALATSQFIDKRYLFTCVTHYGNYHLIDWQELTAHEKP